MKSTAAPLRRIALFSSLSDAAIERIAVRARPQTVAPGEVIILEGEPSRAAYFIASGQVRVYRMSAAGRLQVLAQLGAGQALNTAAVFETEGVNHATAEAVTSGMLYVISKADLLNLTRDLPELALALLRDMANRLVHLTNLVEDLSLRSVRGRLARFLLEHAAEGQVTQRWTQDEMATYLGTVRDVVGRTLRAFADAGMIRFDRQRIVLLDQQALQREAD